MRSKAKWNLHADVTADEPLIDFLNGLCWVVVVAAAADAVLLLFPTLSVSHGYSANNLFLMTINA